MTAGWTHASQALNVTILADTNRDGQINDLDVDAKRTWTNERGALFLANVADTDGRCSKSLVAPPWGQNDNNTEFNPEIERYLDECHDATDNVLRNPKYLAPLRTLSICKGLDDDATATVHVKDEIAAGKSRVFVKESDGNWKYVSANHTFTAQDVKKGLELGIDARDVRRPTWDGIVQVHFTVHSAGATASDFVTLRVAPVLTHHHAQLAKKAFTTAALWNNSQVSFVSNFQKNVARAGIDEPVFLFTGDDVWTQDFFEPGYTSIPGPNGPLILRVMIRSVQSFRESGREIFTKLRSSNVGAVQHLGDGESIDSTGNLETVPPHTFRGVSYPAGRIIMGSLKTKKPLMLAFLEAQETQRPIELDTDWLVVGHVDEFLQFLPADNERGWVLMADDPIAGLQIIEKVAESHASEKAVSRPRFPGEPEELCLPEDVVSDVLKLQNITEVTHYVAERIQHNIDILKRETGLEDKDIFRIPALFHSDYTGGFRCGANMTDSDGSGNGTSTPQLVAKDFISGGPEQHAKSIVEAATAPGKHHLLQWDDGSGLTSRVVALYPGAINGVVLTDSLVLAPNPWGPVIDGVDVFAQAVKEVYAEVGYDVMFQDNWFSHHMLNGEVHCGSNTWREADTIWWQS